MNSTVPNNDSQQGTSRQPTAIETEPQSEETMSTSSIGSLDVAAINCKEYLGTTDVRYIQMRRANHVQEKKEWNLEETL